MFMAVANAAAGQASRSDLDAVEAQLRRALDGKLSEFVRAEPDDIEAALRRAAEASPEAVIVLGGDGTARAAAEIVGRTGVPIAPLPGGTMNILPKKVFGARSLQESIDSLALATPQMLPAGEIGGRRFFLSAALGFAGSLARLRETQRGAFRPLTFASTWASTSRAFATSMTHGVQWRTRARDKWKRAHTLVLAVGSVRSVANPLAEDEEGDGFEIASLDLRQISDIAELGYYSLASSWRASPAVKIVEARRVEIDAPSRRPLVVLDGEPIRLPGLSEARWIEDGCAVLAPPPLEQSGEADHARHNDRAPERFALRRRRSERARRRA